jgi:hypothetical protein
MNWRCSRGKGCFYVLHPCRRLCDAQRAAWIAASAQVPSHGRLGDSGTLTGCQFCVKINAALATLGEPSVFEPPNQAVFSANPVGGLTITNNSGVIALKPGVPTTPARHTLVWATAPCSAGVSSPGRFVILGRLPEPNAGLSDITELYNALYGELPVNKRIFIQTVQYLNGWDDAPKQTTAAVPPA